MIGSSELQLVNIIAEKAMIATTLTLEYFMNCDIDMYFTFINAFGLIQLL